MRKTVLALWLLLLVPIAARADSTVNFVNTGGTLTGSAAAGLTLSGSTLTQAGGLIGSDLGTVSFHTGALTTGSLTAGGTFSYIGSTFTIVGNGTGSLPNGVIFTGSFDGPVSWVKTQSGTSVSYTLTGAIVGTYTLPSGSVVTTAATVQLTTVTRNGMFNGSAALAGGNTNIAVPEPSSLMLFGTGLLGFAGILRRRLPRLR